MVQDREQGRVAARPNGLPRSDRIAARLRSVLEARAQPDGAGEAGRELSAARMATLRAVLAVLVPHGIDGLDLAARIDADLADGLGNGWRPEILPPDAQAYDRALETVDQAAGLGGFAALDGGARHRLLALMQDGKPGAAGDAPLGDEAMRAWFEELRSDAVRHYAAHPAAMASIGYEGAANGAFDGAAFEGWTRAEIEDPA